MTATRGTTAKVVSSAIALCVRTMWERVATLLAMLVIARLLSPHDLGTAALVVAAGAVASTVVDAGITTSFVRAPVPPGPGQLAVACRVQLQIGTGILLVTAVLAVTGVPLAPLLLLTCLKLPLRPLTLQVRTSLQRALEFRGLAFAEGTGLLVQALSAVLLAGAVRGPGALVAADVLGGVTAAAWMRLRLARQLPVEAASDVTPTSSALLRESLPFSGYTLVVTGRDLATNVFVGAFVGVRELGLLQFAYRALTPVMVVFAAVGQLAVPLGRAVFAGDQRAREQVRDGFLLSGLCAAVVLSGIAASARWLVPLAFGARWSDAAPLVVCIALALVVSGPLNYLGLGLLVSARHVLAAAALVVGSAVVFAAAVITLPVHGAAVGAGAWLLMAVVEAVTVAAACRTFLGLHLGRPSVVPVTVFGVAYLVGLGCGHVVTSGPGLLGPSAAAALTAIATAAVLSWVLAGPQLRQLMASVRRVPLPPRPAEVAV